jgi:hypothetical protein
LTVEICTKRGYALDACCKTQKVSQQIFAIDIVDVFQWQTQWQRILLFQPRSAAAHSPSIVASSDADQDSGVRADRPQLAKLIAKLLPGDVVVVTKLDRLGRSTRELLELIERIGKAGAAFRSLGDRLFDTTGAQGRLLVTMLAAIAEFERELIKECAGAGQERAMAEGVKFGRKRKLSDYQRAEAVKRRAPLMRPWQPHHGGTRVCLLKPNEESSESRSRGDSPTLWKNPGMGRVQISRSLEIDEPESHFIFLQKSTRHPRVVWRGTRVSF